MDKTLFTASLKSADTEEWLDVHFTRKVGFLMAVACAKWHIRPNSVTIFSIILGVGAAWMFSFTDLWHNICGVVLLMCANFCDSADGQLARLTHQHSLLGRILDGVAGDIWFLCIYTALCIRITTGDTVFATFPLLLTVWVLAAVAGIACHSTQSAQADLYRQMHLWMLKAGQPGELWQESTPEDEQPAQKQPWYAAVFNALYDRYSRAQLRRAPMLRRYRQCIGSGSHPAITEEERQAFLRGSRSLMKYTNILTFNTRAIVLYVACLADVPVVYFLFEIIILHPLYIYMLSKHEALCRELTATYHPTPIHQAKLGDSPHPSSTIQHP